MLNLTSPDAIKVRVPSKAFNMASATDPQSRTILFVDDDIRLLQVVKEVLEIFGFTVTAARYGAEAKSILNEGISLDLLLTDIKLEDGFDGFQLARIARELYPDLPVLYISGNAAYTPEEMGAVQAPVLQKPFLPNELEEAVLKVISG